MQSVERWLAGVTIVAVAGTLASSAYTASIFSALFGGVAKVYTAAKH